MAKCCFNLTDFGCEFRGKLQRRPDVRAFQVFDDENCGEGVTRAQRINDLGLDGVLQIDLAVRQA